MAIRICLVGLPSSGKSSIINSLCFKRLCQTGISRTTTTATTFEGLKSDDDIEFNICDLPGIADIDDVDKNMMKLSQVIS